MTRSIKVDCHDVTGERESSLSIGMGRVLEERMTSGANFGEFHDLFYKKESRPLGEGWYDVTCFVRSIFPIFILVATKNTRIRYYISTWQTLMPSDTVSPASRISRPNSLQAVMSPTTFFSWISEISWILKITPRIPKQQVFTEYSLAHGTAPHFREL
jgi:hypothetical protein